MSLLDKLIETTTDASILNKFTLEFLKSEIKKRGLEAKATTKDDAIEILIENNTMLSNLFPSTSAFMSDTSKQVQHVVLNPDMTQTIARCNGEDSNASEYFIKSIEKAAKINGWSAEVMLAFSTSKLTGIAKNWQNFEGENKIQWSTWLQAFKQRFIKPPTLREWNERVNARIQHPNESITQYLCGKLEIITKAPNDIKIPIEDQISYLIEGITDNTDRRLMRIGAPTTLDKLFEIGQTLDDDTKYTSKYFSNDKTINKPQPYINNHSQQHNNNPSLSNQQHSFPKSTLHIDNFKGNSYLCPRCKKYSHPISQCHIPCTICNKTGHSINNCPNKIPSKQANCALKSKGGDRGLPIVDATAFEGTLISTLIDSGAEQSVIDRRSIPQNYCIQKYDGPTITSIDNECKPIGQIDLFVSVGDISCTFGPVAVVNNTPIPLILGSDWRKANNLTIIVESNGDIQLQKNLNTDNTKPNINSCIFKNIQNIPSSLLKETEEQISSFTNLSPIHIAKFQQIVCNNLQAFSTDEDILGHCTIGEHSLNTTDEIPVFRKPYRYSWSDRKFINETVENWKQLKITRDSQSEYASPVVIVNQPHHPSTPRRLTVDYTHLNKKLLKDNFPPPHIDDVIEKLVQTDSKIFNVMDIKTAFMTVKVKPSDIHKTAFVTQDGVFEFMRMPFGLANAPKTMERIMRQTFHKTNNTITYMDDIGQSAPNIDIALDNFEVALTELIKSGLRISLKKCQLFKSEIFFLGYGISAEGIRPDPNRINSIDRYNKEFKTKTDAKSFHAFASHHRKFIKDFSKIALPIRNAYNLTPFVWTKEAAEAVEILKLKLKSPPILAHFMNDCATEVQVDASLTGLGAILIQKQNNREVVIAYASRALADSEKNLHINQIESLAIHWAITDKFHIYLYGLKYFTLITDNWTTACLLQNSKFNRKFARWLLDLQSYNFTIKHRAGKHNVCADALSRIPNNIIVQLIFKSNDETKISTAQNNDPECQNLVRTLNNDANTKHDEKIKNNYFIQNNILLYKNNKGFGRIYIPLSLQNCVLEMCHDNSGHMDHEKTFSKLSKRYFWPSAAKDCKQYVSSCRTCQLFNHRTSKRIGLLKPRSIPQRPFDVISMDHCSFPQDSKGNKNILIIIDHTTRYVIAKSVPDVSSRHVISLIEDKIISIHGPPIEIISDNATSFTSNEFIKFLNKFGIHSLTTPPYWPESNGLIEREVQTVSSILRKFISERDIEHWSSYIPEITLSINSSKHSSLQQSPHYLLHGFEPRIRDEVLLGIVECNTDRSHQLLQLHSDREQALTNLNKSQAQDKIRIDGHRNAFNMKVGDSVLALNPIKRNKLCPSYEPNPYEITNILGENVLKIRKLNNIGQEIFRIVHTGQVKKYNKRNEDQLLVDTDIQNNEEDDEEEKENSTSSATKSSQNDNNPKVSTHDGDESSRKRRPPKWLEDYEN